MSCDLTKYMPPMLAGEQLLRAMTILPEYDPALRSKPAAERLIELSSLYQLYLPSNMSLEIYSKLYLALMRSLRKKSGRSAILQKYENLKAIKQQEYEGIIGGSDSFTIIGVSGIGKSSAISRALALITGKSIIEMFCSDRLNAYEVCLVGIFLGVAPEELTRMKLPAVSQPEWFDEKIRTLHAQGLKYPEIARIMGAPYDVVKFIGNKRS